MQAAAHFSIRFYSAGDSAEVSDFFAFFSSLFLLTRPLKFTNGEIDVTILVLIGIALFFELLDQGKHLRNVLSRSRLNARRQAAEFTEIFLHALGIGLGQLGRQNLAFSRTFNNLVVNIGYVADEFDVVAALLEPASCHVKSDKCSSVSNVAGYNCLQNLIV